MDREELVEILEQGALKRGESTRSELTIEKVEERARNIKEVGNYIRFDIERHPYVGNGYQPHTPDVTIQTWRYNSESQRLQLACEFHARSYIEKNKLGDPVCAVCAEKLNRFEDIHGYIWLCGSCGAVGGKKREIFDPVLGEPIIHNPDQWKKLNDKPVWVRKNRRGE